MKRQKFWRVLPKSELTRMMTATDAIDEAQFKMRAIAQPHMWSETRQGSLTRAARIVNISFSLAERIVYRKLKRIDAHVLENIRITYARLEAKAERMADEQLKIQRVLQREIEGRDADSSDLERNVLAATGQSTGGEG